MAPDAPVNIILLDEFNTLFEDEAFARYSLKKYLEKQPDKLTTPTMLLAVGIDQVHGAERLHPGQAGDSGLAGSSLCGVSVAERRESRGRRSGWGRPLARWSAWPRQPWGIPGTRT